MVKTYLFFIILLCNAMLASTQNTPPDGYYKYECRESTIDDPIDDPCYILKESIITCYIPEEALQILKQTNKKKIKRTKQTTCSCFVENTGYYSFPFKFIKSPKDPTYPCSPKMLEYFKMKEYIKEFRCNQFKKNWNADRYPCIFDKDQKKIDECRQTLYEKYCNNY